MGRGNCGSRSRPEARSVRAIREFACLTDVSSHSPCHWQRERCWSRRAAAAVVVEEAANPPTPIGYEGPLTGDNSRALGINEANAVQLAINQANAAGNLPFTLQYKSADDQGDPAQAPAAAQQLLGISNLVAVVGPAFSGATKAVGATYAGKSVTLVSPGPRPPTRSLPRSVSRRSSASCRRTRTRAPWPLTTWSRA